MPLWRRRCPNGLLAAATVVVALLAVRAATALASVVLAARDLPQWDMAKYGVDGLRLAAAVQDLDPIALIARLNAMSSWPPLFPLVESGAFLVFGPQHTVARLLVVALFCLAVPAAFLAGRALDDRDGAAVGLMAAAWLVASPLHQLLATLVMLEIPGTLLVLTAAWAYFRALRQPGGWRLAAVASTALFFCKYNYGLLWLAPVLLNEAWRRAGSWSELVAALRRRLATLELRRPRVFLPLVALLLLAGIRITGGIDVELLGARLKATSIGNPIYALYLLWVLGHLVRPRRSWRRWRGWLAGLDPAGRAFVLWTALPIALWMLVPPHAKDFFGFVENRSSGMPLLSVASLAFYPRAWIDGYTPAPWLGGVTLLGGATLLLALAPLAVLGRLDDRRRALALAVLCAVVALLLHPYKLPRFAATAAPLLFLQAAGVVAWLVRAAAARLEEGKARVAVWTAAAVLCALVAGPGVERARLERERAARTVPAAVRPVVDRIAELLAGEEGTVVLGTWNELSPGLVEWHLRLYLRPDGERARRLLAADSGLERWLRAAAVRSAQKVERQLHDGAAARVVVIEPLAEHAGYAADVAWLEPARSWVTAGEAFTLTAAEDFPAAGWRLSLYRRAARPEASSPAPAPGRSAPPASPPA